MRRRCLPKGVKVSLAYSGMCNKHPGAARFQLITLVAEKKKTRIFQDLEGLGNQMRMRMQQNGHLHARLAIRSYNCRALGSSKCALSSVWAAGFHHFGRKLSDSRERECTADTTLLYVWLRVPSLENGVRYIELWGIYIRGSRMVFGGY